MYSIYAVVPTYFVWPMCIPHVESPSEYPPTLNWIESLGSAENVGTPEEDSD